MNLADNYFIKPDYKANLSGNLTYDEPGRRYWTDKRIKMAAHYQYEVYLEARRLAKKYNLQEVVDLGCGPATKLMSLLRPLGSRVVGIDQPSAIQVCKEKYQSGEFYIENFEKPSLDLNSLQLANHFNLIVCADVIEHLENPNKLLDYAKKIAQNGAYIVLSTPERDVVHGASCVTSSKAEHVREWNKNEFSNYLRSRSFEVVKHRIVLEQRVCFSADYLKYALRTLRTRKSLKTCQMVVARIWK